MDTDLLKNFLVLAELKNFTKASTKLSISQSALSLQVKKLEELIGKPLFIRDNRRVKLTHEGEELIAYSNMLISCEKNLLTHFHESPIKGEVVFGTPEDLATTYLPSILANFARNYPEISLNVRCEFSVNLLKEFDLKNYDVILIKQDATNPREGSEKLWKESLSWVCGKNAQQFFSKPTTPLPLILAPAPCVYRQRAIDSLNQAGIAWKIIYQSPSLSGTLALVKSGLGISILPTNMISKEIETISTLPELKDTQIALVKRDPSSKAAAALASYIKKNIHH
jgi:DNA-binding transcriptional LysR family regulator